MRDSGRLAASIEIIGEFEDRHLPLKDIITNWGRMNRYAGSGDRAWIAGLAHDVLRAKLSLGWKMGDDSPRALALGALRFLWDWPVEKIAEIAAEEPHGPGALNDAEAARLNEPADISEAPEHIRADLPEWLCARLADISGDIVAEGQAYTTRAPVDIRVNLLKSDEQKALRALAFAGAAPSDIIATALRVPAPAADAKAPALGPLPAFGKGFVEVQDIGSQVAALAAGDIAGAQVLDLCAGAGGKTLAMAALAGNSGQIFAWDADGRRLKPIFDRLRRAGARNVQVRSPLDGSTLDDLAGKMDVVFVDAPCTGSGTWRRKPDTKWRLSERQLEQRMAEQDAVLEEAAAYVKPGGSLVYVTCSILKEEDEDRVGAFAEKHPEFSVIDPVERMEETGLLASGAADRLRGLNPTGLGVRLSPLATDTDGFFVSVLKRA